jgi:hypothetical protein
MKASRVTRTHAEVEMELLRNACWRSCISDAGRDWVLAIPQIAISGRPFELQRMRA